MARGILEEYGPDTHTPQAPKADSGGCMSARDVMSYHAPQGPTNINDPKSPGLHGHNCGNANKPVGSDGAAGRPGIGGTNRGVKGTQR